MTDLHSRMVADRHLRDAARALVEADVQNFRNNLRSENIANRALHRVKDSVSGLYDDAIDVAVDNKGIVAAVIAAIVVWLARTPILALFGFSQEEEEQDDDDVDAASDEEADNEDQFEG